LRVVSIRYIALPESGINDASGVHDSIIRESTDFLESMFNPIIRSITPPIERGAAKAKEKEEEPEDIAIVLPSAIHIHADITIFNRLWYSLLSTDNVLTKRH